MNVSHFDKQAQRESTCSLAHGTWRCVGAKIACVGACALMVGQLLLPSLALSSPRVTATQEGLATFAEQITGSIDIQRLKTAILAK